MKILILEAEKETQKELEKCLVNEHYDTLSLPNGSDAIEIIKNKKENIDFIICDIDKPTKNSLDLINYLIDSNSKIPFIFITNFKNLYNILNKINYKVKTHPNPNILSIISWSYLIKPILNYSGILIIIEQLCAREHLLTARSIYCEHIEQDKAKIKTDLDELEDDHKSGKNIHDQLLPEKNQNLLSLTFNYFLHPSLYVSGDFVDYIQLDDRYVLFYLSDVSGHGVSSAFVTVLLKASVSQYAQEFTHMNNNTIINPKEMLAELNNIICDQNLSKYLTMTYFIYDQKLNKLIYSIAGHYPFPILLEKDNKPVYIGERGFPVGMVKQAQFDNHEIDLADKFNLAIFSDGIMEISNNTELDHKEQELLDLLSNDFDADTIQQKLNITNYNNLPDDIAGLFVLKS